MQEKKLTSTFIKDTYSKIYCFFRKLGPGIVTGASDDDPSGVATYTQAGAQFGLSLLWTSLITYPLMFMIQAMCARIGIITENGLVTVLKTHYSKYIAYAIVFLSLPAILFNIVANLAAVGAVLSLLFPLVHPFIFESFVSALMIVSLIGFSYKKIAKILKYLCLALLSYLIIPFLVHQEWKPILYATFVPQVKLNKEYFIMLTAVLGTTISPYLFFWQTTMSCEQKKHNKNEKMTEIYEMRQDVNFGMFISNIVMYFIILTAATVLLPKGVTDIKTVEDAAIALRPLAGEFSYLLFSIGIVGVGLLSIPVLASCIGYIFAELFDWKSGLDNKFHQAPRFYIVIVTSILFALLTNIFQIDPVQALILTAIIYGIIAPFLIFFILLICNNSKIVGMHTNTLMANLLGIATLLLMSFSAIFLLFSYFL